MQSEAVVKLVDYTHSPYDLGVAAARTCYSGRGIITPEEVSADERAARIRDRVGRSTLKAGHLTTRQHARFVFAIEGVSRHLVWSFLHSHPFYNSEQVSQRYVEVKPDQFYRPPALEAPGRERALNLYESAVRFAADSYFELTRLLEPVAREEYFKIFPARLAGSERRRSSIHKRAMEAARYVLPTATCTYLYHTINALTLHRYRRLACSFDVPRETRQLVEKMHTAVQGIDPLLAGEMADTLPLEETLEYDFFAGLYGTKGSGNINWNRDNAREFVREFDAELGGGVSRLAGFSPDAVRTLAAAVRAVLGLPKSALDDSAALELALDPARNRYLHSTLNESSLSKITRALYNVQFVFQKKLSHTADSQDQRHRLVPGSRPVLFSHYTGEPDHVTPALIAVRADVHERYEETMRRLFALIEQFLEAGGTSEEAVYLLPNAFPVRFYESGDLLNLHHKWKTRVCYNAQEEIFNASVEELRQAHRVHPELVSRIGAPCLQRRLANSKPFCPEGDRFCGVKVWNLTLDNYQRTL